MIVNEKSRARVAFGRAKIGSNSKDFCNARAHLAVVGDIWRCLKNIYALAVQLRPV